MRLILGILAMFALLTGSAHAQSPLISDWTEKKYSEEDDLYLTNTNREYFRHLQYKRENDLYVNFLSGVHCSGRYCDNKNFKTLSPMRAAEWNRTSTGEILTELPDYRKKRDLLCPAGQYIFAMGCEGPFCETVTAKCTTPLLPAGVTPACGFEKTISEEGASEKKNEVVLATYQLFNGYKCEGDHCDNMTMRYCNIYGGEKDHIALAVKGARWKHVGSIIGGTKETSYTAGLEESTGSSDTVHASVEVSASATLEVEGSVGFGSVTAGVTAGVAVTGGYAREFNRSKASTTQLTVMVSCNQLGGGSTRADIYAFSLLTKNKYSSSDVDIEAVSDTHYSCAYGKSDVPAPVCLPTQCDNSFATNCQKCSGLHMTAALGETPAKVKAVYSGKDEDLGSFVEFYGRWRWNDSKYRPARQSRLVLYNDTRNGKYTFCEDAKCSLLDGEYIPLRNGAELILTGVFGEKDSEIVFTSGDDGVVNGEYWRDVSVGGEPDGTVELQQL